MCFIVPFSALQGAAGPPPGPRISGAGRLPLDAFVTLLLLPSPFSPSSFFFFSFVFLAFPIPIPSLPASQHREDPTNTADHAFDFTEENYKIVEKYLAKYPSNFKRSATIPLLDLAQRQCGNFLPLSAMQKVARILGMTDVEVYEVATFYTMFNRERVGKYFIQLCGTTPCMVNGSEAIKQAICKHLGIEDGETTKDGLFTLKEVECLGACANAPMLQLNDDFYECLTPETTVALLEACKKGAPPKLTKWGSLPMNGQVSCEGPKGKTSLFKAPTGPTCRALPEKKVDPASVAREMLYQ